MSVSMRSSKGFSLVELAISVTIVGILIAAVIKGEEILQNSKVTNTVAQVKKYSAAVDEFRGLYGALPGDYASTVLGCDATCENGNGDGRVVQGEKGTGSDSPDFDPDWNDVSTTYMACDETFQFWKHLAAAGFVDGVLLGVNTTTSCSSSDAVFGETHPKNVFGGGVHAFYDRDHQPDGEDLNESGHYFRITREIDGDDDTGDSLLTPVLAWAVDRKADDGAPYSGQMTAAGTDCAALVGGAEVSSAIYDRTKDERNCAIFYKFSSSRG